MAASDPAYSSEVASALGEARALLARAAPRCALAARHHARFLDQDIGLEHRGGSGSLPGGLVEGGQAAAAAAAYAKAAGGQWQDPASAYQLGHMYEVSNR